MAEKENEKKAVDQAIQFNDMAAKCETCKELKPYGSYITIGSDCINPDVKPHIGSFHCLDCCLKCYRKGSCFKNIDTPWHVLAPLCRVAKSFYSVEMEVMSEVVNSFTSTIEYSSKQISIVLSSEDTTLPESKVKINSEINFIHRLSQVFVALKRRLISKKEG